MSPQTRRILLHIGAPKCGSTYLQRVLLRNSPALERIGVRYPHEGAMPHPGNAGTLAAIDAATLERHFSGGVRTLVYSHEDLFPDARQGVSLARLAAECGIALQIIVFLRPFSEIIFGDYSQHMKQHFERYLANRSAYDGQSFETFVEARRRVLTPVAFLDRWQALVPGQPLRLESHRRIRPAIEEFLGGDHGLDWRVPPSEVNPSLRMVDCDRLGEMMHDPACSDQDVRAEFKAAFRRTGDPDSGRSAERAALVEARFAEETRRLASRFAFDTGAAHECVA